MITFDPEIVELAKQMYSDEQSPADEVDALSSRLFEECAGSRHMVCLISLVLVASHIISEAPPPVQETIRAAIACLLFGLRSPDDEEPLVLPPGAFVMPGNGEIN